MKLPRVVRDALLIGFVFLGLQTLQAILLKRAMGQEENLLAYRLASGVAGVLNQAHRTKDDLSIYRVLDALAQSPGVIQARIVNQAPPGAYSYPLQDGAQTWGTLALSISDHFSRTLTRQQWLAGTAVATFVWIALFLYLQFLERQNLRLQTQISELEGLLQAEKRKLSGFQERERLKAMQDSACLQKAVERLVGPLVILDTQQRISAINAVALARLGFTDSHDVLEKSWQAIPILASCGPGLERSLASPGEIIEWPGQEGGQTLKFETDPDGMSGTWVSL